MKFLQGFSPALLRDLHESSRQTGDRQMKYLLDTMLERKEVTAADVLSRVNFILKGLPHFPYLKVFYAEMNNSGDEITKIFSSQLDTTKQRKQARSKSMKIENLSLVLVHSLGED